MSNVIECPTCMTKYVICGQCQAQSNEPCILMDVDPRCHKYHDNSSFINDEDLNTPDHRDPCQHRPQDEGGQGLSVISDQSTKKK